MQQMVSGRSARDIHGISAVSAINGGGSCLLKLGAVARTVVACETVAVPDGTVKRLQLRSLTDTCPSR
jgi:hypothetical protein